ncbi:hypothetical protein BGZ57DRAFT_921245 [Hyaloscypha finlandica]|nr:hypothetical protein BGZ57DRAFT_921245 [Hyaloscypha finlandica]
MTIGAGLSWWSLMAPINRALNEVNVHANERWTNESKKNVDLDKLRSKDRVSAPYSSTSLGGSSPPPSPTQPPGGQGQPSLEPPLFKPPKLNFGSGTETKPSLRDKISTPPPEKQRLSLWITKTNNQGSVDTGQSPEDEKKGLSKKFRLGPGGVFTPSPKAPDARSGIFPKSTLKQMPQPMGTKPSSLWPGDAPSDASSNTSTSAEDLLAARIESDESESADDTASPIASDDLLVQNPNYWRLGDAECQDMFLAIQCMQNGLRDQEVDLTGYKYPGSDNAVVFITEHDIDQIRPREADWQRDDMFLLMTQKEALMGQLNALLEV